MPETAPPDTEAATGPRLRVVGDTPVAAEGASAQRFSETVRTVVAIARRANLRPPVFLSPPRLPGVDRSIRRGRNGNLVVAIRREGRPLPAVQADVIEGFVVANGLDTEAADRFRRAAWAVLEPSTSTPERTRATMEPAPTARVA